MSRRLWIGIALVITSVAWGSLYSSPYSLPAYAASGHDNGSVTAGDNSDPEIEVDAGWSATTEVPPAFFRFGEGPVFNEEGPFTFTSATPVTVRVTDDFCRGDQFRIFDFGVPIGDTSAVAIGACEEMGPDAAFADPTYSSGSFPLGPGAHSLTIQVIVNPFGSGRGYIRVDSAMCILNLAASLTDRTLTLEFDVGTREPATWNVWLIAQAAVTPVVSAALPVIEPPASIELDLPFFPALGTVGFLTTLTTPVQGIICSALVTVDTGPSSLAAAPAPQALQDLLAPSVKGLHDQLLQQHIR
jgi:hypothetical protein